MVRWSYLDRLPAGQMASDHAHLVISMPRLIVWKLWLQKKWKLGLMHEHAPPCTSRGGCLRRAFKMPSQPTWLPGVRGCSDPFRGSVPKLNPLLRFAILDKVISSRNLSAFYCQSWQMLLTAILALFALSVLFLAVCLFLFLACVKKQPPGRPRGPRGPGHHETKHDLANLCRSARATGLGAPRAHW